MVENKNNEPMAFLKKIWADNKVKYKNYDDNYNRKEILDMIDYRYIDGSYKSLRQYSDIKDFIYLNYGMLPEDEHKIVFEEIRNRLKI